MSRGHLGIDMGGTASRWVVVDGNGDTIARGVAPGATGHLFNPRSQEVFATAIKAIAQGVDRHTGLEAIHLGATGIGPRAFADAERIVAASFHLAPAAISISDDMDLAFRAAFAPGEGHLISAGTGSIGLHLAADGSRVRVGGRGILIDDGGSGSWIALTALDRLYRILDATGGFGDAQALADGLHGAIGGNSWDDVRVFVYGAERGAIGALARTVAQAADAGDPVAQGVIADAAVELARLGHALVARAGDKPIGYVGGLLDISPRLKPALLKALAGLAVLFPAIDAALAAANLARVRAQTRQD